MAEIIDVMSPMFGTCPTFTVNTAVNYVQVIPDAMNPAVMNGGNFKYKFQRGDFFTVLSVGYFVPEQFALYGMDEAVNSNTLPILKLFSADGVGYIPVSQFGSEGEFKIHMPNTEISVGVFVDTELLGLNQPDFKLYTSFPLLSNSLQISMINVPAALNGITFKITPFIKVLHNFKLTA